VFSCTITTFAFALNYHVRHPHPPAAMAQGAFKQSTKAKAPKAVHSKKQASKVSKPKVPQLEATEAQLARFPKAEPAAEPAAAPALPPTTSYPPLESPRR
ncbi:MAG: hypothetical protein E7K47_16615, partial [Acidovorax sp.]|nr:hypothetical protein [Acidovorax sp.]